MGCAISSFSNRIVDLSKRSNFPNNVVSISAHNLHTILNSDNPNPKCIFIFGGPGSNKGQFIWEVLEQSCENYTTDEKKEALKLILEKNELHLTGFKFSYFYIDVEKLIIENLDKRIEKLTMNFQINGNHLLKETLHEPFADEINSLHLKVESPEIFLKHRSSKRRRASHNDELKTRLLLYANIITNSWVLSLIKKEIEDNNFGPFERIFIINLIPNQISIFMNCLFLKQTPSFINFDFNFIAINLMKHISKRKDLEIKVDELYDEFNNNFINYFRLINKLIDVKVENHDVKLYFKLSTSTKHAISIENKQDLISFMLMPKKDQLKLNIFNFRFNEFGSIFEQDSKKFCGEVLFIINKEIELDDNLMILLTDKLIVDLVHLRKFIQLYRLTKFSLNFV